MGVVRGGEGEDALHAGEVGDSWGGVRGGHDCRAGEWWEKERIVGEVNNFGLENRAVTLGISLFLPLLRPPKRGQLDLCICRTAVPVLSRFEAAFLMRGRSRFPHLATREKTE